MNRKGIKIFYSFSISFLLLATISVLGQSAKFEREICLGLEESLVSSALVTDIIAALDIWVNKIGEESELNYEYFVKRYHLSELTKQFIEQNDVFMLALSYIDYLKLKDTIFLEPIVAAVNPGGNELLLISNIDHDAISDCKNRKVALVNSPNITISEYWLDYLLLKQKNQIAHKFFREITYLQDDSEAIYSTFFHKIDACIVNKEAYETACELNPQIRSRTKILNKSESLISILFCYTDLVSKSEKQKLTHAYHNVNDWEEGKQILKMFKINKLLFHADLSELMLNTEKLYNNVTKLKSEL